MLVFMMYRIEIGINVILFLFDFSIGRLSGCLVLKVGCIVVVIGGKIFVYNMFIYEEIWCFF